MMTAEEAREMVAKSDEREARYRAWTARFPGRGPCTQGPAWLSYIERVRAALGADGESFVIPPGPDWPQVCHETDRMIGWVAAVSDCHESLEIAMREHLAAMRESTTP